MNQIDANAELDRIIRQHSCGNEYSRIVSNFHLIAEFKRSSGFSFWVSSQENEFTIGFDNSGECIWHQRIASKYGFEDENQKAGLKIELNGIFRNISKICISTNGEERFWKDIE